RPVERRVEQVADVLDAVEVVHAAGGLPRMAVERAVEQLDQGFLVRLDFHFCHFLLVFRLNSAFSEIRRLYHKAAPLSMPFACGAVEAGSIFIRYERPPPTQRT